MSLSWKKCLNSITGYRQHCAKRKAPVFKTKYISYSEADLEVFHPAGRHVAPMGVKFGMEGPLLHAKWHPHWCNSKGIRGPQKLKFLRRFDQNVEYKCPAVAYPMRDFHKICRVCTPFQDTLTVKISLVAQGVMELWDLSWRCLVTPNFQRALSAKLCVRSPKVFEV